MSSREARRPTPPSADEPPIESPPAVSNQPNSVMLGPRDRVIGQLYIEGDLRVGGIVEGGVEVTGDVEIGDMAKVKASVTARDVSIRGHLVGAVVARKRLEVTRSGSLIGDVRVARLTIQDGATFSGKVSMGAAAAAPAKVAEPKPAVPEPKPAVPEQAPPVVAAAGVPGATVPAPIVEAAPPKPAPPKPAIAPAPAAKAPPPSARPAEAQAARKDGRGKPPPPKGKPKRR